MKSEPKKKTAIEDDEAQARIRAAEIEDSLQEEDYHRDAAANHPPPRNVSNFRPNLGEQRAPERDDSGSSGDEYAEPENSGAEDDSDELQDDVVAEDEEPAVKQRGKKSKFVRDDVTALRTSDVTRTEPVINGKRKASAIYPTPAIKKHKNTSTKHWEGNTFNSKWVDQNKAAGAKSVAIAKEKNNQADDSLVRMGGITSDEEDEEAERVAFNAAASVPQGKANVMPSNIRITPGKQVMTKTDLRGGSKKWNLNHIPADAKDVFSDKVVPLVKAKVGTMEPWASIDLKGLQKIVDDVFGDEGYELSAGDAWTGL
ncbi:hypothetical protein H0H92_008994, partial [Tricholoma furcatifolium]